MRKAVKFWLCCFSMAGILALGACEDDPILDANDSDSSGGGSYGLIDLDSSDASYERVYKDNPETY